MYKDTRVCVYKDTCVSPILTLKRHTRIREIPRISKICHHRINELWSHWRPPWKRRVRDFLFDISQEQLIVVRSHDDMNVELVWDLSDHQCSVLGLIITDLRNSSRFGNCVSTSFSPRAFPRRYLRRLKMKVSFSVFFRSVVSVSFFPCILQFALARRIDRIPFCSARLLWRDSRQPRTRSPSKWLRWRPARNSIDFHRGRSSVCQWRSRNPRWIKTTTWFSRRRNTTGLWRIRRISRAYPPSTARYQLVFRVVLYVYSEGNVKSNGSHRTHWY